MLLITNILLFISRRPLISFPMTQEDVKHFNMARKTKINQQILDGFLDPSAAITAPSIFVCIHRVSLINSVISKHNKNLIYSN